MSADHELNEAYQEWRRLAEAEGQAIQTCNWSLLSACQKALQNLQGRITTLSAAARAEWKKLGAAQKQREEQVNATIFQLIELEKRNNTLLKAIRETTHQRLEQLDRAGKNLKRVHRMYSSDAPVGWSSFS
ncbi:MAG: hypothetical protein U1F65_04490 [Verrucomicrobiota bacterium]